MDDGLTFGRWLQRWRKARDLTQDEFAAEVICSAAMIREIEADRRKPSRELARRIVDHLPLPVSTRELVIQIARGERSPDRLPPIPATPVASGAVADNLPVPPTPLLGRSREVGAACKHLRAQGRLLTLTGVGGVGKTHLALEVAARLRADFALGSWFVDLAPVRDPELVAAQIARALGVRESGGRALVAHLADELRGRHLLLVLDNFEQVVAAAPLVARLLAAAPRLKVLVTSREALRIRGEKEHLVPPLAVPDPRHLPALDALRAAPAIALFVERAQAIAPDFELTEENAAAITAICERLDGLPLAIELAAARVRHTGPRQLLAQLERRLPVLTGGARDLPARQQTLRSTLDWSYGLLTSGEQLLFARLAVFVGGATLGAIEAVSAADGNGVGDVREAVASLVEKHLLRRVPGVDDNPRFSMLETLREYAWEHLVEARADAPLEARHAAYYLGLAEALERLREYAQGRRVGPVAEAREVLQRYGWGRFVPTDPSAAPARPQGTASPGSGWWRAWLRLLVAEYGNLRAALRWSEATERDGELGLRLAVALGWFWHRHGDWAEGRRWLEAMLARPAASGHHARRAWALFGVALLAWYQADAPTARERAAESLAIWQELDDRWGLAHTLIASGLVALAFDRNPAAARAQLSRSAEIFRAADDRWGLAVALTMLGYVPHALGEAAEARALFEQGLELWLALDDPWGSMIALTKLGELALEQGDYTGAIPFLEASLARSREEGNKEGMSWALHNLGLAAQLQGDGVRAAVFLGEGLVLNWELGHTTRLRQNLEALAGVILAREEPRAAARLLGAAEALGESTPWRITALERTIVAQTREALRSQLDEATMATALREGRSLPPDEAVAHALATLHQAAESCAGSRR